MFFVVSYFLDNAPANPITTKATIAIAPNNNCPKIKKPDPEPKLAWKLVIKSPYTTAKIIATTIRKNPPIITSTFIFSFFFLQTLIKRKEDTLIN